MQPDRAANLNQDTTIAPVSNLFQLLLFIRRALPPLALAVIDHTDSQSMVCESRCKRFVQHTARQAVTG